MNRSPFDRITDRTEYWELNVEQLQKKLAQSAFRLEQVIILDSGQLELDYT